MLGNILARTIHANIVCARDSKHHNVGQYLLFKIGKLSVKKSWNGPVAQKSNGVCKRNIDKYYCSVFIYTFE